MSKPISIADLVPLELAAWGAAELADLLDEMEDRGAVLTEAHDRGRRACDRAIAAYARWTGARTVALLRCDLRPPPAGYVKKALQSACRAIVAVGGVDCLYRENNNAGGGSMVTVADVTPPARPRGRRRPAAGKKRSVA